MLQDHENGIFRFGAYEADPGSGELRKSGVRLRVQEQPFQVLLVLLERPSEVVTREELRQKLWPADTFVDFDHSLNTVINKLREALSDSAANPRFIETSRAADIDFWLRLNLSKTRLRPDSRASGGRRAGQDSGSQRPLDRPRRFRC